MDKKAYISKIQAEVRDLDPDAIRHRLKEQLESKVSGNRAITIKDWTIEALRRALKSKRNVQRREEQASQAQREAETIPEQQRKAAAEIVRGAHAYLTPRLLQNGENEWTIPALNDAAYPTKKILLSMMMNACIVDQSGSTPVSTATTTEAAHTSIQLTPTDSETPPGIISVSLDKEKKPRRNISILPRTPAWAAIEVGKACAFAIDIASLTATDPTSVQNAVANAVKQEQHIATGILAAIGQKPFTDAINTIQKSIAQNGGTSITQEQYWDHILQAWPTIQLQLDDTITMLPPRSRQEAIDRVSQYLVALMRTQVYGFTLGSNVQKSVQPLADAMLRSIPQKLDASMVVQQLPHYDRELLQHPGVTLAREGESIVFVAPRAAFASAPLKDSDLQCSLTSDPLTTKMRVAALDPAYDDETYLQDAWVSGSLFMTSEAKEEAQFRARCEQWKDVTLSSLASAMTSLRIEGNQRTFVKSVLGASWHFSDGHHSHEHSGNAGQLPISVDFTEEDGLIYRWRYDPVTGVPEKAKLHPALSTKEWLGVASLEYGITQSTPSSPASLGTSPLPPAKHARNTLVHAMVQDDRLKAELDSLAREAKNTADVSVTHWPLMKLRDQAFFIDAMKRLGRMVTRKPPASMVESMTRFDVLGSILTYGIIPDSLITYYPFNLASPPPTQEELEVLMKEKMALNKKYFDERPIAITLESQHALGTPYKDLFEALGIPLASVSAVRCVREGDRLHFVCHREDLPSHRLFHRALDTDEERTLDLVVAADESLDTTIEQEKGKWVSGTLPTVKELEDAYLSHVQVDDSGIAQPAQSTSLGKDTSDDTELPDGASERREQETIISDKMRIIRNVLLQMSVQGLIRQKPVYAYHKNEAEVRYDIGAADNGKTVIQIPDAALTIIVIPGSKTRVVLNAGMTPDAFKNLSVSDIDRMYGKLELTFNDAEQFARVVQGNIEQRLNPNQRIVNYPVGFEGNPSPLRTFPDPSSKDFLLAIFRRISELCGGKALDALTLGDVRNIVSGNQWPLGSNTHGHTLLMNIWRELPTAITQSLILDSKIENEDYRKLRALFDYLLPIVLQHLAEIAPEEARIDSARSGVNTTIGNVTGSTS